MCAVVTEEFLTYSKIQGNDLSTPVPAYNFPGLSPGDAWCLCASRWLDAQKAGCAPFVNLAATHQRATEIVPLATLKAYAAPQGEEHLESKTGEEASGPSEPAPAPKGPAA